jgi:hypothetical protein
MTQEHPITPPPELIEKWIQVHTTKYDLARKAAQWGAAAELDACCELLNDFNTYHLVELLRAARRPKPPSLKEQALLAVDTAVADYRIAADVADVVRRALEQIDD